MTLKAVIFDFVNVLAKEPDRIGFYTRYFGDEDAARDFLQNVFNKKALPEWNTEAASASLARLKQKFPGNDGALDAYERRFEEFLQGPVDGMPEIVKDLKSTGLKVLILSNFGDDLFERAKAAMPFLSLADGHIISGALGFKKPDPRMFETAKERLAEWGIAPAEAHFFDDKPANIEAARKSGIPADVFEEAGTVISALKNELPPSRKLKRPQGLTMPA